MKAKTIIDVRSPAEFSDGNVTGSVNIPLQEIQKRMDEIKSMEPIIFCCASGNRSGQATIIARSAGINCENGGSWMETKRTYQL
jgi:phage shock protein E